MYGGLIPIGVCTHAGYCSPDKAQIGGSIVYCLLGMPLGNFQQISCKAQTGMYGPLLAATIYM